MTLPLLGPTPQQYRLADGAGGQSRCRQLAYQRAEVGDDVCNRTQQERAVSFPYSAAESSAHHLITAWMS